MDMWKSSKVGVYVFLLVIIALAAGSFFAVKDETQPPIKNIHLLHGSFKNAAVENQGFRINLNNEIDIQKEDISITPKIGFSLNQSTDNYEVSFTEKLQRSTGYEVNIGDIKRFNFKTKDESLVYLKRNYEKEEVDRNDQIIETDTEKGEVVLFEDKKIKTFTANHNYLIAIVEGELQDRIVIIDRRLDEQFEAELPIKFSRVDEIDISEFSSKFAFTLDMDFTSYTKKLRATYDRVLYQYDIRGKKLITPKHEDELIYVDEIKFVDENTLLYRDVFDKYYLYDLSSGKRAEIGSFFLDGGVSEDGNLVLLLNSNGISIHNNNEDKTVLISSDTEVLDFDFTDDNSIVYLKSSLDEPSPASSLNMIKNGEVSEIKRFDARNKLPTKFSISNNSKLIAMESDLKECDLDWYDLHSRCKKAQINVFDLSKNIITKSIDGIMPQWIN